MIKHADSSSMGIDLQSGMAALAGVICSGFAGKQWVDKPWRAGVLEKV